MVCSMVHMSAEKRHFNCIPIVSLNGGVVLAQFLWRVKKQWLVSLKWNKKGSTIAFITPIGEKKCRTRNSFKELLLIIYESIFVIVNEDPLFSLWWYAAMLQSMITKVSSHSPSLKTSRKSTPSLIQSLHENIAVVAKWGISWLMFHLGNILQ